MEALPSVPKSERIPVLLAELCGWIAAANRENGGLYSFCYFRGKWIELEYWNGEAQEIILPKDTRITEETITYAIRSVKHRAERKTINTGVEPEK